ncbi:heme/hemin ABC transporter substrate-binding protein [Pararhizobium sp.]|uniref:heme/hemin ABC transporter substrate-binding protein n=1 Tax=Pararhizobium sp. TaxID=1977563 RepID=UPI00271E0387|nr:hemin ABC transporter substrate-binding protein [Pararhizobium sp.]MDO9414969.1 hemin ABC transporter substrate-binding protein [Pararhizobium sp.]
MTHGFDFRRIRSWELALALFAVSAPFVLPIANGQQAGFIGTAVAEEMQKADTSKLVSIGGSLTEIIFALGEEGRLVGRDSTSVYPEAANKIPDVGYMRALSPEGVMAINPTAIIAVEGSGPPEALALLKSANIPFETVPEKFDRDSIISKILAVGKFLGVDDKAKALADKVSADLDAAVAEAEKRPGSERKRVLFILSLRDGKVMASGTNTAANGIITLSGAINATGDYEGYKPLSDEAIIEAKPDVILMMDRGGSHSGNNDDLRANPALGLTPAVQNSAVIRMDGHYLLGFGPRTAESIRDLSGKIYGKPAHVSQ